MPPCARSIFLHAVTVIVGLMKRPNLDTSLTYTRGHENYQSVSYISEDTPRTHYCGLRYPANAFASPLTTTNGSRDLDILFSVRDPGLVESAIEVALLLVGIDAVSARTTGDVTLFFGRVRQKIVDLAYGVISSMTDSRS